MKEIHFWFLFIVLVMTTVIMSWYIESYHKKEMKKLEQIERKLEHRSQLDSLYWNHLEECAFELKDELIYSQHN